MKSLALCLLLLAACGGSNGATTTSPSESGTIRVSGSINRLSGGSCPDFQTPDGVLEETETAVNPANHRLVVKDGAGMIIGTTTTDAGTCKPRGPDVELDGAALSARYGVDVQTADFYVFEMEGYAPTQPLSHAEVTEKHSIVHFDAADGGEGALDVLTPR